MPEPATLFLTLGTSPAIVPEAFLRPGHHFSDVHILTSSTPDVSIIKDFFQDHAPEVRLSITRVKDFSDLASERDHHRFEEALYRWLLHHQPQERKAHYCLSGGFKTMSAAMQKAATLFGAESLFHVLATTNPSTIEDILHAKENNAIKWIELGPQPGWPQIKALTPGDFPLDESVLKTGEHQIANTDTRLRERINQIEQSTIHLLESWNQLSDLPFPELATWSPQELAWLRSPLAPESLQDKQWVQNLPKAELHCHLGGFATHGKELEQIREHASFPDDLPPIKECTPPTDWPMPGNPVGLNPYRNLGDNNGSALLKDPGCLQSQCQHIYQHLCEQNISYAEIRCSPGNYTSPGRSAWEVLSDIRTHFQTCMESNSNDSNSPCHINLIIIGTRQIDGDYRAGITRHLALAVTAAEHWSDPDTCRVVGVDLAGFEDPSTRAHYFREEFTAIHRSGLALTVHAGENDDAEGIWRAVFDLNARRIGHALTLDDSPALLRSVIDRGIGIEMCPYANYQIRGYPIDQDQGTYPLLRYLRAGAKVTINTDNIGISAASLSENYLFAARLCPGITRLEILQLLANAFSIAFDQQSAAPIPKPTPIPA